ncbi:MAG: hypothetical protein Q9162_005049 [Coniocarpon cinnabarinum]
MAPLFKSSTTPTSQTPTHTTQPLKATPGTPPKLRDLLQTRHENIYTLPNALTFSRLLATPALIYFILHSSHVPAVALLTYASVTDLLDGYLARRWKQESVVGSILDPMADKALMIGLTTTLAYMGQLPMWLAVLVLGRDVSLAVAAVYFRFASLPSPKTLARYWDFSLPSASVHPTPVSKLNTLLQLVLIGATTALPLVPADYLIQALPSTVLDVLGDGESVRLQDVVGWFQWIVAGTTVWSGLSYTWARGVVRILRQDMAEGDKRRVIRRGRGVIGVLFGSLCGGALWIGRPWE